MNIKTHHTALRPTRENFERTIQFYTETLGFKIDKQWDWKNGDRITPCAMIHPGDGIMIEIFGNGMNDEMPTGAYPHVCYEVDDVAALMKKLEAAGYSAVDPQGNPFPDVYTDFQMREEPPILWRCGFVKGPCNEIIEFLEDLSDAK